MIETAETKKTLAPRAYRLADLLNDFDTFADRIERARATGEPMGPTTGIKKLDRQLCGYMAPGLHILKGDTGAGKTAFALQLAASCQCPALYVSCEMSAQELLRRHTARVTQTHLGRFKDTDPYNPDACEGQEELPPLPAAEAKALARKAVAAAPSLVLIDSTLAFTPPDYLQEEAEALRRDLKAQDVLLVIDSLHSWARGIEGEEYGRLEMAINSLQSLAHTLKAPILCISERTKEANKGSETGALDGAGHRAIGYGAESVISLTKDKAAKPDGFGWKPITLVLDKNRNGPANYRIDLKFHGGFQAFKEAS